MLPERRERGSASVEFALVLPFALLLLLALVQVGVLARDRLLVEAAARAGARAAAVEADPARVRAAAMAAAPTLEDAWLALELVRGGGLGDPVTVRVRYDDPVRVPLLRWVLPELVRIEATAVARQEFG